MCGGIRPLGNESFGSSQSEKATRHSPDAFFILCLPKFKIGSEFPFEPAVDYWLGC